MSPILLPSQNNIKNLKINCAYKINTTCELETSTKQSDSTIIFNESINNIFG